MTRHEEIINKNIDEFADWLNSLAIWSNESPWEQWFEANYCSKCAVVICKDPDTGRDIRCSWCELHDQCKYFPTLDTIPDNKYIIKQWLRQNTK